MLAWVTGATGFVGSALVERLRVRGDDVLAIVRPSSRNRAPRGARVVEAVLPDIGSLESFPVPDVVFHCAAAIEGTEEEGRAVHVDATLRLAAASRGARFVNVSTTDVLPISSAVPLSESDPCAPHDAYGRTKLEGERRLLAAFPRSVTLRPPGIYGPGSARDVVLHTAERIQRGRFFFIGDGHARRSWIFVETLVDALLHVASRGDLVGPFLVDDGRSVSRRELAREIAGALGTSAKFPTIPARAAGFAAWIFERALPPFGVRSPLTTEGVRYASTSLPLDTTKWKATGFSPRFDLRESIALTLEWGRATGRLRP